jgi:hypothetical protein
MRHIHLKYKDNFSIIFLRKWLLQGKAAESYMIENETRRLRAKPGTVRHLNLTYWDDTKSSMRRDASLFKASI